MAQPVELATTLGSVVSLGGEYGVVWHRTCDTLRVLPIKRGRGALPLSLANEVALHLPAGPSGWGIVFDELVSWSRVLCAIVGELDERCLLKIMEARKTVACSGASALATDGVSAAVRQAVLH
jgi:hypothetical protein